MTLPEQGKTAPAVLLIYGGGFAFGDKAQPLYAHMAAAFAAHGCAAFSINYTLTGGELNGEYRRRVAAADAAAALDFLRGRHMDYQIDPCRIAVQGDSAGGAIAAALAFQESTAGGTALLFDMWGGMPPYGEPVGGPVYGSAISPAAPPVFLLHAVGDPVVPFQTSADLAGRLAALGIAYELRALDSDKHYPEELAGVFLPWMLEFMDKYL